MHSEAAERQLLENDLRQAIERGELSVHYQPIVRTAGEEISGFEALVRWTHPSRGAIGPDKFIPLAEEAGLIASIGEWVLKSALEEAAHWPDQVRVAVNLSPLQFNHPHIVATVARAPRRRPAFEPPGSSSRSPKACSWPRATPPTKCSRSSRSSASAWRLTISALAIRRSAI